MPVYRNAPLALRPLVYGVPRQKPLRLGIAKRRPAKSLHVLAN